MFAERLVYCFRNNLALPVLFIKANRQVPFIKLRVCYLGVSACLSHKTP